MLRESLGLQIFQGSNLAISLVPRPLDLMLRVLTAIATVALALWLQGCGDDSDDPPTAAGGWAGEGLWES